MLQNIKLYNDVVSEEGYKIISFKPVTEYIKSLLLEELKQRFTHEFIDFEKCIKYISLHEFDSIKAKSNRLINQDNANKIQNFIFNYLSLTNENCYISDEELINYPNFNWRVVRPNSASDVGPVHADKWFWDLNKEISIPKNYDRIKFWIPLIQSRNEYSLYILPGSQNENIEYDSVVEKNTNKIKPLIKKSPQGMIPALTKVGEAIYFNDNLLHGGKTVNSLRCSVEFTLVLKVSQ
jgi:hypothetical protein